MRAQRIAPLAVALTVALVTELSEIRKAVIALGQLELRQVIFTERELNIAHFGYFSRVFDRLGILREQCRHFLRRAEIEILRLIAHAVLVIHRLARLNTEQNIVRVGILLAQIVRIVRHDQRQPRLLMQAQYPLIDDRLLTDAVILQLKIEVIFPKDLSKCQGIFLCAFIVAAADPARDLAGKTGRECDQAAAVLAQQVKIDARLDIKALNVRHGNKIG